MTIRCQFKYDCDSCGGRPAGCEDFPNGHMVDKFSSLVSGDPCPVAVDDIKKMIRYPVGVSMGFNPGWESYFNMHLWKDYPNSHHTSWLVII